VLLGRRKKYPLPILSKVTQVCLGKESFLYGTK